MTASVSGRLTVVRPATRADTELLVAWHADPDVARYWDGETFTYAEIEQRLAQPDVESFVIEAAGEPVGYVQAWLDETGTAGGLDMFLVPGARGRRLGPDAARALAEHLLGDRGWTRVTADPYLSNAGGVRAWRRAGFEPVGEHEPDAEHASRWLLMEFRPPRPG
jgi:aminoglycoside 6'-N-acetyltransferase